MKSTSYESAINHWKNGYLAWNPKKYSYYKKNFYIGLTLAEYNQNFSSETGKIYAFYDDTDHELEDRSIIYKDMSSFNTPEYNYYIKVSSKETIDNITEADYNEIIIDFEHKIKSYKIKNKLNDISKDFE
jgi:hypothetical protein